MILEALRLLFFGRRAWFDMRIGIAGAENIGAHLESVYVCWVGGDVRGWLIAEFAKRSCEAIG